MPENFNAVDVMYMQKALDLARQGEGRVSPNPPVGCVLVKDGSVVGQGWHDRLGALHAEAAALRDAGERARGAVCYVTLSPCATHGRQPPCTEALIEAGVSQVIVAAEDPSLRNACGAERLRQAGIPVRVGLLRDEAEYLARGFFTAVRTGLPYVTLKYAMTLDGKIASTSGDSQWISGPESREVVQHMRSRHDAILVGSGTALADDPQLTLRDPVLAGRGGPDVHPQPIRVIADSRCRLPLDATMLQNEPGKGGLVLIATTREANSRRVMALANAGAEVVQFDPEGHQVPLRDLMEELAERGVNLVLCEGGAGLAAGLLRAGLVHEIVAFVATRVVGGNRAPGPVADLGIEAMSGALPFVLKECIVVGDDIMITARKV